MGIGIPNKVYLGSTNNVVNLNGYSNQSRRNIMRLLFKFSLFIFLISINVANENNITNNYKYYLSVRPSFESSTNVNFGFPEKNIEYNIDFSFNGDFNEIYADEDEYNNYSSDYSIIRKTTRDYPIDINSSFSLNRKKINEWKSYKNMKLSNYWGAGLQASYTSRLENYKRIEIGNYEDGLFTPDTIVVMNDHQTTNKNVSYGINLLYGIKFEYAFSSIFGTSIKNDDFVFELDCRLIKLNISKYNLLSERIDYQESASSYGDDRNERSYYRFSMGDPYVNFYIKYYF